MKTQAAVLYGLNEPWRIVDVELGEPVAGEVRVRLAASGLCHSDEHLVTGDIPAALPVIGGHEGAGVVDAVGPEVHGIKAGDHVVLAFIPACGRCPMCSTGHQNLCDQGAHLMNGVAIADGTYRVRDGDGNGIGTMCLLGTFCPYVVVNESQVVLIDEHIPLRTAALVGCGVTTGWGSAVYAAQVGPGDTVVVIGIGGVGINAVQGARLAGARRVIAVDPLPFKRETALSLGATHVAADLDEALKLVTDLTWGRLAEKAILTAGVVTGDLIAPSMKLIAKSGCLVVTGVAPVAQEDVKLNLFDLTLFQKQIRGCNFGSANPRVDIPKLLGLSTSGQLELDALVTRTYSLDEVNAGYDDLREGRNIRGLIVYE
jgi:NDMA-dependent alcohol dehydrogenase